MKSRHAVALTLVGWYLMAPTISNHEVDMDAALSKWDMVDRFDSAAECKHASDTTWSYRALKKRLPVAKAEFLEAIASAQCIATDDPRLNESRQSPTGD
jgi:hypothetical protein